MCGCVSESIRVPLWAHRGGFEVSAEWVSSVAVGGMSATLHSE